VESDVLGNITIKKPSNQLGSLLTLDAGFLTG